MESDHRLSEKWIKASIIGTIWAASEIVLGSFLHNLKVPFSGNILTAIGLIILISMSYVWTEKGLFWRAGIICALLKTMSPSAVIFGPMVAIFTESLLLELFVRLLGRTIGGYILGSMAAMSWNLFQQIINYIIFYGSDIINVYTNLLKMAQRQLAIKTDIVWLPIIILLIAYALFGLLSAVIGIRTGRKMRKQPASGQQFTTREPVTEPVRPMEKSFSYSVIWLIADVAFIIISFFLLNKTPWQVWSAAITGIIIIWSLRYKRALRQLSKPKFWIFFVLITILTAFVFTRAGSGESQLQKGLLTGFQMNFRAAVMILGFSVLGTELYNPVIRSFFLRTSFKNLPLALELSVESLPSFIAGIPDFKTLIKNPVSIFYQVISQADRRLAEIKNTNPGQRKIFIVTGAVGQGKTTFVKRLSLFFSEYDIKAGGIISERVMNGERATGYDVVNIETGEKEVFLREDKEAEGEKVGRFSINPKGLEMGISVLNSLPGKKGMISIIDEIGLLEVSGRGWANCLERLFDRSENHIIITVRDSFVDVVRNKWKLSDITVFDVNDTDFISAGQIILKLIKTGK
jgi:nucleoside-triphosphatase THEP1